MLHPNRGDGSFESPQLGGGGQRVYRRPHGAVWRNWLWEKIDVETWDLRKDVEIDEKDRRNVREVL